MKVFHAVVAVVSMLTDSNSILILELLAKRSAYTSIRLQVVALFLDATAEI